VTSPTHLPKHSTNPILVHLAGALSFLSPFVASSTDPHQELKFLPITSPQQLLEPPIRPSQQDNMATTFTCFPKLPKEIQLNIWKEAASETRNVGVWIHLVEFGDLHHGNGDDNPYLFTTNVGHPAILHTSRESRREGLRFYQLTLGSTCQVHGPKIPPFTVTFPARTYINWKADRICIMQPLFRDLLEGHLDLLGLSSNNCLTKIAFNTNHPQWAGSHLAVDRMIKSALDMFSLEEFTLFDREYTEQPMEERHRKTIDFDVIKPPLIIQKGLEKTGTRLIRAMKKYKRTGLPGSKAADTAQADIRLPWKIRFCRYLVDGQPEE